MDERFPQGNDLFRCRAINQFGELLKKITSVALEVP